jgi:MoaA/NifB/PqqE/SkfB family radical SAM enzyme
MSTAFAPKDKLLFQAERIAAFERDDTTAPPALVEISPTNSCNAKCPWCFYVSSEYKQHHSQEWISPDVLGPTIVDMSEMGVNAITWTGGGDPSTYPHIGSMVDLANTLGIKQGMFTNAYKAIEHPEQLDWIRVTITERFLITRHVAHYAAVTKVGVNFNLTRDNESHLRPLAEASRKAGVRYFQVRPALADRWDLQQEVQVPLYLRDLETDEFKIVLTPYKFEDHARPHGYAKCHGHRLVPFVWHNGDLSVCAYHFGRAEYTFGNLNANPFREIWNGARRHVMILNGIDVISSCQHCCKNHEINKVLASLKSEYERPDDIEFI